jgi:hypothetical protein
MKQNKYIFLFLALIILLAIFKMPYFYYQLLRWIVCSVLIKLSYDFYLENKRQNLPFIAIAVVFNPIAPIYFGVWIWKLIDLITGLFFIYKFFEKDDEI